MCGECSGTPEASANSMDRRRFLKLGGAGLAGAATVGAFGPHRLLAQTSSGASLASEFRAAQREYGVPEELLLAMGYVNTMWEMPPPETSPYEPGDLHGRGAYGVMQLLQNPSRDTLGRAATLTGISERRLKTDRASNVRGGAAVLAALAGRSKPRTLDDWQETVAKYAYGPLYAQEVYEILESGASLTTSTGESLELEPQDEVETRTVFADRSTDRSGNADYWRARWYGAYHNGGSGACANQYNYCRKNREEKLNISRVVIHVAEGSYSGTISWFNDQRARSSAHYVVGRQGQVAQCVRDKNIAYHAGNWWVNKHSIGIEHAGYGSNRRTWSDTVLRSSARLSAYVSKKYDVPVDKKHFVRHRDVSSTLCPGRHFDMDRYLRLVRMFK